MRQKRLIDAIERLEERARKQDESILKLRSKVQELDRMVIEPKKPDNPFLANQVAMVNLGDFTKPTTWRSLSFLNNQSEENAENIKLLLEYFNLKRVDSKCTTTLKKKKKT